VGHAPTLIVEYQLKAMMELWSLLFPFPTRRISIQFDVSDSLLSAQMSFRLVKAIKDGDSTQLESLLASGSIDVNARLTRNLNPPPLVFAVQCKKTRHVGIVEMLLRAGAHIDGVDDNGQTASFAAVRARSVDVLAVLLAHRPNLELTDNQSRKTPLQFSINSSDETNDSISVMLINAGASLDSLPTGALCKLASRSTSAIQALLNRGVVLNQLRNLNNDNTPLHLIASRAGGDAATVEAVVKMLINQCGADVEERVSFNWTCVSLAASSGNVVALRCCIDAGADVNCITRAGHTPLHVVSDYECSILLLAAGAGVNARDKDDQTAFQLAASKNKTLILPALLAAGADPSDVTEQSIAAVAADRVETARRGIAKARLDFVRHRALQVCIGLQSLSLDALQMSEILQHACGPVAHLIAFHQWWKMATTVKHFKSPNQSETEIN
jgi:ankyrin repeat protein